MKKVPLLFALGAGFVLGSRAGRGPYEQVESEVRKFLGRPEVHDRLDAAKSAASQQFSGLTSKLPTSGKGDNPPSEPVTQADDTILNTE